MQEEEQPLQPKHIEMKLMRRTPEGMWHWQGERFVLSGGKYHRMVIEIRHEEGKRPAQSLRLTLQKGRESTISHIDILAGKLVKGIPPWRIARSFGGELPELMPVSDDPKEIAAFKKVVSAAKLAMLHRLFRGGR